MKKILLLLFFALITEGVLFAQSIDSLRKMARNIAPTALLKRRVDSAFQIEIAATRLDTVNFRRFIINDSLEIVREIMPLNTYPTTDTLGNVVTVLDIRIMYRVLTKTEAIARLRNARQAHRQRESAILRARANAIDAEKKPPNSLKSKKVKK